MKQYYQPNFWNKRPKFQNIVQENKTSDVQQDSSQNDQNSKEILENNETDDDLLAKNPKLEQEDSCYNSQNQSDQNNEVQQEIDTKDLNNFLIDEIYKIDNQNQNQQDSLKNIIFGQKRKKSETQEEDKSQVSDDQPADYNFDQNKKQITEKSQELKFGKVQENQKSKIKSFVWKPQAKKPKK